VPAGIPEVELVKAQARASKIAEIKSMSAAIGRYAARNSWSPVPDGLEGDAAEAWMDQELTKLGPKAVAALKMQLELGDDVQRERAANKVMDALGRGKRESGVGGSAPVIILTGDAVINPPWKKKVQATVDAVATPILPEKKDA
jgi:hypothetical protein